MTPAEIQKKIATIKRQITEAENKIDTLQGQTITNYSVNDGQYSQSVKKQEILDQEELIERLERRLERYEALQGGGTIYVRGAV